MTVPMEYGGQQGLRAVGSPASQLALLDALQPNILCSQRPSCILGSFSISHITAIPNNIQASSKSFHLRTPTLQSLLQAFFAGTKLSSSEAQAMSIGNWTQHWKWTANPFAFRAPYSLIHKEQPSMAETFALSVGVLAFILALPSGSEVRVKEGCCFFSARPQAFTARPLLTPV